ncbi:MarR family winged helix-turn-helix transcriptional regulator [Actinomycetaceae bacterium L2_0104]
MSEDNSQAILSAACLQLGMLGARITQTFSTRIERIGLTHKQVGLLAVVDGGLAHSQREIAARLEVAPSLVVSLVDQLIELGAVKRERSTSDRRVQNIVLTDLGRDLLAASANVAAELDGEFRANLSDSGQTALDTLLAELETGSPTLLPST